jgi:hypothetical protein
MEMRDRIILVDSRHRRSHETASASAKNQLGEACIVHPPKAAGIAGREPKGFLDMSLGSKPRRMRNFARPMVLWASVKFRSSCNFLQNTTCLPRVVGHDEQITVLCET